MTLCVLSKRAVFSNLDTVICSRDKDLRICPGLHFGWETSQTPQFGPTNVSELGELSFKFKTNFNKKLGIEEEVVKEVKGSGLRFFYAQMVMGDKVDNIPGLPRRGVTFVHNFLKDCETEEELFNVVRQEYENLMGDNWREYMLEQGRLLWMCRELDDEGKPIMWEIPDYGETRREDKM